MAYNKKHYLKSFQDNVNYEAQMTNVMELPHVVAIKDTNEVIYRRTIDYSTMYLTFDALEDGTFSFNKKGVSGDMQYSKDGGSTWNILASGNTVNVSNGEKIIWKSDIIPADYYYGIGFFQSSIKYNISGNVMSLLYGDSFSDKNSVKNYYDVFINLFKETNVVDASNLILPTEIEKRGSFEGMFYNCKHLIKTPNLSSITPAFKCYSSMFSGCTSLTEAPVLPATTLGNYCYSNMFQNCTSLTTAPELPATTLAESCYDNMFNGCTSLVNAPELPATTLANDCYSYMFYGCTSLTTAPVLPATTLEYECYRAMFAGCTGLVHAPELPATTLDQSCYINMFTGCTSLIESPVLPATTLTSSCYSYMFSDCRQLSKITMLATNISASNCLNNWANYISATGTFIKHPDMTSLPTGSSGIPEGWTVQDYVADSM